MHRIAQSDVLPALRDLISQHPAALNTGPEMLTRLLWILRFLDRLPAAHEVAAAVEVLQDDDGGLLI